MMNYIGLVNNFWKCDMVYSFSGNETKLYFYLLHASNSLGWKNPIRLSYKQIERGCNLTVNTIKSARVKLSECGLIEFETGSRGSSCNINNKSKYCIKVSRIHSQEDIQSDGHTGGRLDNHADSIYKHRIKQNKTTLLFHEESEKRKVKTEKRENSFINNDFKGKEKSCAKKESEGLKVPTIEEVNGYIVEKGYVVNAEKFVNYYTANGWMMGKNPMRDWKAAIRMWESNDKNGYSENRKLCSHDTGGITGNRVNSSGVDAQNRRAELDDLERLAETIIRQS